MTNIMKKCKERLANARKNDKGFTLVELIVVIVILAILIGVTVGGVSTYIGQSRKNTDINNAASITSVLGTLAADETVYKAAKAIGTDAGVDKTLEWKEGIATAPTLTVGSGTTYDIKIGDLLTDGLPKSQTGDGFQLKITFYKNGNVVVKCVAGASTDPATSYGATNAGTWN